MARIDKYDPKSGGFRAALAADRAGSETPVGVGLDVNGRVVVGDGNTGIKGVLADPENRKAGDIVDSMTDGDLVEFGGVAGTNYYAAANGTISTDDTGTYVGHTVEGNRLVVRVAR